MHSYVILLRGINVGGKNKISMAELKLFLEELGFTHVTTYIQSGNVILRSPLSAEAIQTLIEEGLPKRFQLDSSIIRILALTKDQLQSIITDRPKGFGDQPNEYHSDVVFLMGISPEDAMKVFDPREGVDQVWAGEGVVYSQRLSALRTKSRLNKVMSSPLYKSMTIRNWNTTTKLLAMLEANEHDSHRR
jgi:uncharacterized protein (DUF1697 family)